MTKDEHYLGKNTEATHVHVLVTEAFQCGEDTGAKLVRDGDGNGPEFCRCGTCA